MIYEHYVDGTHPQTEFFWGVGMGTAMAGRSSWARDQTLTTEVKVYSVIIEHTSFHDYHSLSHLVHH